jgi:hypothetical protein
MRRSILPALLVALAAVGCTGQAVTMSGENLTADGGFESQRVARGWPDEAGQWGGDAAKALPGNGRVRPAEGRRMLKFVYTSHAVPWSSNTCEVVQVVDLADYEDLIRTGAAEMSAAAVFNRVAGDEETDTRFAVSLFAYAGEIRDHFVLRESGEWLARADEDLTSDADPASWQQAAVTLALPPATDFVTVQVCACENVSNDRSPPEFDGHYADRVFISPPH